MGLAAGEGEGWNPFSWVLRTLPVRRKGKAGIRGEERRMNVSRNRRTPESEKGARCLPGPALGLYPAASWGAFQEQALDLAGQAAVLYDCEGERQWQLDC